jgi:hypothetical protein
MNHGILRKPLEHYTIANNFYIGITFPKGSEEPTKTNMLRAALVIFKKMNTVFKGCTQGHHSRNPHVKDDSWGPGAHTFIRRCGWMNRVRNFS